MLEFTEISPDELRLEGFQQWDLDDYDLVIRTCIDRLKAKKIGDGGYGWIISLPCPVGWPVAIKFFVPRGDTAQRERNSTTQRRRFAAQQRDLPGVVWPVRILSVEGRRSVPSEVVGLTMPLMLDYISMELLCRVYWRSAHRVSNNDIVNLLKQIHDNTSALHRRGILAGDFKPDNFLVSRSAAYRVDADALGYPGIPAEQYTPDFLAPELAVPNGKSLICTGSLSEEAVWYAFAVMVWMCLMQYHPLKCGTFPPGHKYRELPGLHRGLHNLSALMPEVSLPKDALPPQAIGAEAFAYFCEVFHHRRRGVFPREILEHMTWQRCRRCRIDFATPACPNSGQAGHTNGK